MDGPRDPPWLTYEHTEQSPESSETLLPLSYPSVPAHHRYIAQAQRTVLEDTLRYSPGCNTYISLDRNKIKKVEIEVVNIPSLYISLIAFGVSFSFFFLLDYYYSCYYYYYSFYYTRARLTAYLTLGFLIFTLTYS